MALTELARAHAALAPESRSDPLSLGGTRWKPPAGAEQLERGLRRALEVPAVVDLVLYGSQARNSTTSYSDVDAILVLTDEAARHPGALRELRPRILRAQRHVLEYQPLQHHAFEVVTPALLQTAERALQLPAEAVAQTAALFGRRIHAAFVPPPANEARARFERMADQLQRVSVWPSHPWAIHRLLSMFELLPALFLQSKGRRIEKWRSFDAARERFPAAWQPYEVLREIRERWPAHGHRTLRTMLRAGPNPWLSVELWRRAPVRARLEIRSLLTPQVLRDLHTLIDLMRAEASR